MRLGSNLTVCRIRCSPGYRLGALVVYLFLTQIPYSSVSILSLHLNFLLTVVRSMIQYSTHVGSFPDASKLTLVTPLLKKGSLDKDSHKDYWANSVKSTFVSKLVERSQTPKSPAIQEIAIKIYWKINKRPRGAILCLSNANQQIGLCVLDVHHSSMTLILASMF